MNNSDLQEAHYPLDLIWAIEPTRFARLIHAVRHQDLSSAALPVDDRPVQPEIFNGVAVIELRGIMEKRRSLFGFLFGGTSTAAVRQQLKGALDNKKVNKILLRIDSPGGTVDGLAELGDAVFQGDQMKPVIAQVDGIAFSGAYYVASQARQIYAQRMDEIGSIGVRTLLYDWHGFFEAAQVKAIPIDTGKFKSLGAMGTEISEEQRQHLQGIVDSYFQDFQQVIQRARPKLRDKLSAVTDAQVFLASEALELGLIDGIQTLEQTLASLQADPRVQTKAALADGAQKELNMNQANDLEAAALVEAQAATIEELETALPASDATFQVRCLKDQLPLAQAKERWYAELAKRHEALTVERGELAEKLTALEADNAALRGKLEAATAEDLTVGASEQGPDVSDPEAGWKAQWARDAELRAEFGNEQQRWLAYQRAATSGRVRLIARPA